MSWEKILQEGWGKAEFRLKITGIQYEFVTNQLMVQDITDTSGTGTGGTIYRRAGLLREGLTVAEEVIIPENRVELAGNSFTIVDLDYNATRAFYDRARRRARLAFDYFGPDARTIGFNGGRNWKNGDILWIGSEAIRLVGDPTRTSTGNWVFTCQRAKLGTIAQYHYAETQLGDKLYPWLQDAPYGIENQRVSLYAYGDGDDLLGDGTLVWRGIVTQDASCDGMNWSLEAGPITEILKTEIGNSGDDVKFRGIYHSNRPLRVRFQRSVNDRRSGAITEEPALIAEVSGFHENKWELAAAFNAQLGPASRQYWSDTGTVLGCQIIDGELVFTYHNEGGDPRWVDVRTLDGIREIRRWTGDRDQPIIPEETVNPRSVRVVYSWSTGQRLEGDDVRRVQSGRTYAVRMTAGPYPDILLGYVPTRFLSGAPLPASRDPRRLYLDIEQVNLDLNKIAIYGPAAEDSEDDDDVRLSEYLPYPTYLPRSAGPADLQPEPTTRSIRVDLNLAFLARNEDTYAVIGTELVNTGNVADFLEALVNQAPDNAAQGFGPLLHPDDFDIDDIRSVLDSMPRNFFTDNRKYVFYKKGATLEEILQSEYKLYGVYPILTKEGRMSVRPFRQITASENPIHDLGPDDILTDERFPTLTPNKYGIWNSLTLQTLYDPVKDEYVGPPFTFNNFDSIAANGGKRKSIEVEPVSYYTGQIENVYDDIAETFLIRQTEILSRKYYVVSIDVPMTMFSASIGDTIRITNRQVPNPYNQSGNQNRRRGTSLLGGFITRKEFYLDQGFGSIEFLASPEDIVGEITVAPVAIAVAAPVIATGTTGSSIFVSAEDLGLANNQAITDHLRVGDSVVFERFNDLIGEASGIGRVESVTVNGDSADLEVVMESPASLPADLLSGAGQYCMCLAPITTIEEAGDDFQGSDEQRDYATIDEGSVDFGFDMPALILPGGFSF